jgi:hypothetical protein
MCVSKKELNKLRCWFDKRKNTLSKERQQYYIKLIKELKDKILSTKVKTNLNKNRINERHNLTISEYVNIMKKPCEKCGSNKRKQLHHIDWDKTNNSPDNKQVICKSCHEKIHGWKIPNIQTR